MHSRTEKIDLNDLSRSIKHFDFSHMDLREKSFVGADKEKVASPKIFFMSSEDCRTYT